MTLYIVAWVSLAPCPPWDQTRQGKLSQSLHPTASACTWDLSRPLLAPKGFVLGPLYVSPTVVPSYECVLTQSQGPIETNFGVYPSHLRETNKRSSGAGNKCTFLFRSWRKTQIRVEWESKTGRLLTEEAELCLVLVKERVRLVVRDTHRSGK